jgi:hypothetical protein
MFIGSWLSGAVVQHFTLATHAGMTAHAWRPIWLLAASASAVVLVLFFFAFHDNQDEGAQLSVEEAASAQALPISQ